MRQLAPLLVVLVAGCASVEGPAGWERAVADAATGAWALGQVDDDRLELVHARSCPDCLALGLADRDGDGRDEKWELTAEALTVAGEPFAAGGTSFALADLDSDGALDAMVLREDGALWLHLAAGEERALARDVRAFAAAFLDDDTVLDVVASTPSGLLLLPNDASAPGTFGPGTLAIPAAGGARSIHPYDLDNDQRVDLVVATPAGVVLVGNGGSAGLRDRTLDLPDAAGGTHAALAADVDNDGWPDVVALREDGSVLWWRSVAFGKAWAPPGLAGRAESAYKLGAADLDGDGRVEVLLTGNAEGVVSLEAPASGHSFRLRLRGNMSNDAGVGAKVTLSQGTTLMMRQSGGAAAPALLLPVSEARFGLGPTPASSYELAILWPAGTLQFERVAPERILDVRLTATESESGSPWDSC